MKVYIVKDINTAIFGVFSSEKQAKDRMLLVRPAVSVCTQEIEVHQLPTWTVWSKPNSAEAASAALTPTLTADFKVGVQLNRVMVVNVSANDIREAIDIGESAFRMHQISNQQENSK